MSMLSGMNTTRMTVTRTADGGDVIEFEIQGLDLGDGQATFAVDADVEVGDQFAFKLPNGKIRVFEAESVDVNQSPFGGNLDHTLVRYGVVGEAARLRKPAKVAIPDLHALISDASGTSFAGGHYDAAVFQAFKAVEHRIRELTGSAEIGKSLMASVFNEQKPQLDTSSERCDSRQRADQLEGYKFLFMGCSQGLRNPRGHGPALDTSVDEAREMLSLASLLIRALDRAEARKGTGS